MNIGQYIALNVPSLKDFSEPYMKMQKGSSILKALSTVMLLLRGYVNFYCEAEIPLQIFVIC